MRKLIPAVAATIGILALTGCGSVTASTSDAPAKPALTPSCTLAIAYPAYIVKFTNPGTVAVNVTGFSVAFTRNGQETGDDTEPGNGTVNGINTIGMNNWVLPGDSIAYSVELGSLPAADACQVVQWNTP